MECLHLFCRECIDKSMRMGNNECPTCRTHCASCRSLRDDPNYDSLIAALSKLQLPSLFVNKQNQRERKEHQPHFLGVRAIIEIRESGETIEWLNTKYLMKRKKLLGMEAAKTRLLLTDKSKEDKTLGGAWTSQPFSEANAHVGFNDNDSETNRKILGSVSEFLDSSKIPARGSGCMSSDTNQCSPSEATDELSKNNRVLEFTNIFLSACENDVAANTKE